MSASPNGSPTSPDLAKDLLLRPEDRNGVSDHLPPNYPTTISAWRSAQIAGDGLERLCSLVAGQRHANSVTQACVSLATDEHIREQWQALDSQHDLPLHGVPFAVDENMGARGSNLGPETTELATTLTGSDSPVVARLKAQGAILIGKIKMDLQETRSVVSCRPDDSAPNANLKYVSAGSGSAMVVALGVVPFALDADTDVSGRMPAALINTGIYGLRATKGAIRIRDGDQACESLDSVCIFTTTADDAETIMSLVEDRDAPSGNMPISIPSSDDLDDFGSAALDSLPPYLAVADQLSWFGKRSHSAAYAAALQEARRLGWHLVPRDLSSLFELGRRLADGASTADALADDDLRQSLKEILTQLQSFHGILLPTIATPEQVVQDPTRQGSKLGTYTGFVNLLNCCAITFPAGFRQDNLPFGLTLISSQGQEHKLLRITRQWVAGESRPSGATYSYLTTTAPGPTTRKNATPLPKSNVELAVVGVRLTGSALGRDLASRGAKLDRVTTTAASYRLYTLDHFVYPAGLGRMGPGETTNGGREVDLEIWSLPNSARDSLATSIGPPLALGSIELKDGGSACGFVCEARDPAGATEITDLRAWEAQMAKQPAEPPPRRRIARVLIANRGEIAVRIIRTLRRMEIEAVAVYSDADADTAHVRDADVALRLPGATAAETYLNADRILALARSASADAIIPGYGFLAENAGFARRVEAEGMLWIGPSPPQMSKLGLKHTARKIAAALGIPVIPGGWPVRSVEEALDRAREVGFPLMLKSSAGGGGIGLRRCDEASELEEAMQSVQRLAETNFGNGCVILERFITRARHVEVQILGNGSGRVITAGERDCSLQRRYQKVVEESPALMVPDEARLRMRDAAVRLVSALHYRTVGTVEFLYDMDTQGFYFLEVNTRLQVEHPITEAVTGLDLVEAMIQIAADGGQELFRKYPDGVVPVTGVAIEARLYAEDPSQGFRPCAGRVLELELPLSDLRVDTWISRGAEVSACHDPMLAKLIARGKDRREAVARLAEGLGATKVGGIETNLEYLKQLVASAMFQSGDYTTRSLEDFRYTSASFRVVEPGCLTTIQDWPGRTGYWNIGVPPSGPMDDLSFRIANRLVGNQQGCAGLECTMTGPSLIFHCDAIVAVVGAVASVHIDEKHAPMNQALCVPAGSTLKVGSVESGARFYIAIRGGIDVPLVMGSRSTFELGQMGGSAGRKLQRGDLISLLDSSKPGIIDGGSLPASPQMPIPRQPGAEWTIGVVPGPHGAPDFFTEQDINSLFGSKWTVHYNSNRLGIRLKGPRPQWARQHGGEAGLHPSNIHDSPYSIGSVSFTGDDAVVLTRDGPSLGGFVVFCVVASAEMWKLGQVRPGDSIRLLPVATEKALALNAELSSSIDHLTPLPGLTWPEPKTTTRPTDPVILGTTTHHNKQRIQFRRAGDSALLLEFGEASTFNLRQSFEILAFVRHHQHRQAIPGAEELTPGACTLHVRFSPHNTSHQTMTDRLARHMRSYAVPGRVPSRRVRLPLAFDDAATRAAVARYAATVRAGAPWVPSNVDFLARLNGVGRGVLRDVVGGSEFLVLGLGDVYLGSPCAVPLDPRHRLFGTKYNPSRTFTPKGAVGIGGQYMCIYAAESPGGYQLVGRTVDNIWAPTTGAGPAAGDPQQHCLFDIFDRISFYPITEAELDAARSSGAQRGLVRIEDGVLDLEAHEAWEDAHRGEIEASAAQRDRAIRAAPFLDELIRPREEATATNGACSQDGPPDNGEEGQFDGCERVEAGIPGRCWRLLVKEGEAVKARSVLANLESCKMDVQILSPVDGVCVKILVNEGAVVDAHDTLMLVRPHSEQKPQDI
ncbi:hypothetical protein KVR01_013048 [Diaporthe batatas]|uniref:uncharacterized protein n=1 Tax=Diaporthe batatas TaxID=748121 RepID=UPI001D0541C6|nr:uncharacterized protein KVR01_013048 [Diaporthe batatas]KAG8157058.1 hypothetical protein KVR01_013048 [Diaporthe batatas]